MRTTRVLFAAAAGLGACNALVGNESITYVDADASTSPDAANGGDGSGDGASGNDAADDATNDATNDAPVDARIDGDATLLPDTSVSCDASTFCSTFDPPLDSYPFNWEDQGDASVYLTDTVDFLSAPEALRIDLPNNVSPRALNKTIVGQRPLTVIHGLYVRAPGGGEIAFLEVRCSTPVGAKFRAGIDRTNHLSLTSEGTDAGAFGPLVPEDTWLTLVLTISDADTKLWSLQGGAVSAVLTVPETCEGPYIVRLGFPYTGTIARTTTWTALFDDVKVTVNP